MAALVTPARLAPYLSETGTHVKKALKLYHWNVEVSGAVYEVLHGFEVCLRNAMDEQLCWWNATQTKASGGTHASGWLLDPSPLLERIARRQDIDKAKDRAHTAAAQGSRQAVHGDVLAQLSMGTWRFMLPSTSDSGKQRLWADALVNAFPYLTRGPYDLVAAVDRIHRLRNRVAHLEPLLRTTELQGVMSDVNEVLGDISPHTQQWVSGWQRVTSTIARRP